MKKTSTPKGKIAKLAKDPLRLFVWTGFSPEYTDGLAFAVARTQSDAEEQILKRRGYAVHRWGNLKVYPLTQRVCEAVSGGG